MRGLLAIAAGVASLGGCRAVLGIDDPQPAQDATTTPMDATDAGPHCYGTGLVQVCLLAPVGSLDLSGSIDTDDASCLALTPGDPSSACLLAAGSITVGAVRATGSRPLVLLAAQTITVNGPLDVASHRADGTIGAAADSTDCLTGQSPSFNNDGGGGWGGSFGTRGGGGGDGNANGNGATSPLMSTTTTFRSGCSGSNGADNNGAGVRGAGGHGGGAVYLIAGGGIDIQGAINASGAAGGGAANQPATNAGGGGGGSGGFIGIDAASITIAATGTVFAVGGAGGEGSNGGAGRPGDESTAGESPAGGQNGSSEAGEGGNGDASMSLGINGHNGGGSGTAGGGGGGGGAGVIRLFASVFMSSGSIAPPPT